MKLNHKQIEDREVIENYILGKLDKKYELAFEEHMLICEECRRKCELLENILDASESKLKDESKSVDHSQKSKLNSILFSDRMLRIAAALVVLISITYLIFNSRKPSLIAEKETLSVDSTDKITVSKILSEDSTDTYPSKVSTDNKQDKLLQENIRKQEDIVLARLYEPSPVFENATQEQWRSTGIIVQSPIDSIMYSKGENIEFIWQYKLQNNIIIILRDNKGKAILTEEVVSGYERKIESPGLYYWQLMIEDEIIYTGKFSIDSIYSSE